MEGTDMGTADADVSLTLTSQWLCVSLGPLRSRSQNGMNQARDLLGTYLWKSKGKRHRSRWGSGPTCVRGEREERGPGLKGCSQACGEPPARPRTARRSHQVWSLAGWMEGGAQREGCGVSEDAREWSSEHSARVVARVSSQGHVLGPTTSISFSSHCVGPWDSLLLQVPGALSRAIPLSCCPVPHVCLGIFGLHPGVQEAQKLCGGREGRLEAECSEGEEGQRHGPDSKGQFPFLFLIFLCQPWVPRNEQLLWHHEG